MTGIYEFLQAWGPQEVELMRGCPIKNYVTLVSRLNIWQDCVSSVPTELVTKGKLLLLSCRDIKADLGECCLSSRLPFHLQTSSTQPSLGLECPPRTLGAGPSLDLQSFPEPQGPGPFPWQL